ncbi:unnamed protein product [Lathyrus oleraceus]
MAVLNVVDTAAEGKAVDGTDDDVEETDDEKKSRVIHIHILGFLDRTTSFDYTGTIILFPTNRFDSIIAWLALSWYFYCI